MRRRVLTPADASSTSPPWRAITGLADLKGKKVRVYDQSLAKFIEKLGGIPVTIPFGETQQALERGVTDCAITGPSSANSAGWPEVTTHFMPIGFQIALNAYAMSLPKWNALPADQKTKMESAFKKYEAEVWAYSRELFDDAVRCNVGKEPCKTVKKYHLKEVPVTAGRPADDPRCAEYRVPADLERAVRQVLRQVLGDLEADRRPGGRDQVSR